MKEKITEEIKSFWNSLDNTEKQQFYLLSISYRNALKLNNNKHSGKFIEIPKIKKSYNSNIFVYECPWNDYQNLTFEFINQFKPLKSSYKKHIISSNLGSIKTSQHLIESWVKYINEFEIMNFK